MKNKILVISCFLPLLLLSFVQQNDNQLSSKEKKQGWKLLFDGKSMEGWRYYKNEPSTAWEVGKGVLHSKGTAENYGSVNADLITKEQYQNFELSLDYKISPKGNSGILYLVTEDYPSAYLSGPEYQIIDDVNFPEKLEDWQRSGANYAMNTAPDAKPNPAGQWNHATIIVNNGHVQHWLNGKKVVDYTIGSDEWNNMKANGKWKDAAGYAAAKKGHIALQDHGSEAWFKNIKIREL